MMLQLTTALVLVASATKIPRLDYSLEPAGVCGEGHCWDMAGNDAPEIEKAIRPRVGNLMPPDPEHCFRFLIYREGTPFSGEYGGFSGELDWVGTVDGKPGQQFLILRALVDKRRKSIETSIQHRVRLGEEFYPRFQDETTIGQGVATFSIGKPSEVPKDRLFFMGDKAEEVWQYERPSHPFVRPTGFRMWEVPVGVTLRTDETAQASIFPVDKKGKYIEFVDRRGRPISAEKLREIQSRGEVSKVVGTMKTADKAFRSTFWSRNNRSLAPANWCDTNVDPRFIGSLRVTLFHMVRSETAAFPLNPR